MKLSPVRVWRRNCLRREGLGKKGRLEGFTVVRVAPEGLGTAVPYVLGIVRVGSKQLMVQVVGVEEDELRVGMELVGVLRRMVEVDADGVILYGVKFARVRGE